jgi:hypothetical protein
MQPTRPSADTELKKDLHAAVRTAQELGPDYESAVMDGFLERLEARLDAGLDAQTALRVRQELDRQQGGGAAPGRGRRGSAARFGYTSLVLAVPLSAIGGGIAGLPGLLAAWLGIVGVNVAQCLGGASARRREERLTVRDRRDGWD